MSSGSSAALAPGPPARLRGYRVGPLVLDLDRRVALVGSGETRLTRLETRFLAYLIEHPGVRTRTELLRDVWGYGPGVRTRTLDTLVKRLRGKLGTAGALIETVNRAGHRLSNRHAVAPLD